MLQIILRHGSGSGSEGVRTVFWVRCRADRASEMWEHRLPQPWPLPVYCVHGVVWNICSEALWLNVRCLISSNELRSTWQHAFVLPMLWYFNVPSRNNIENVSGVSSLAGFVGHSSAVWRPKCIMLEHQCLTPWCGSGSDGDPEGFT